ncbi:MAG: pilus assembly protein [Caulobacter sp.]|nr:pilus assembly protein [Caulobacter sp.]
MIRFLRKLARDKRGVSAVEFALIAPAMVASYFGMAEITQALLAERKAAHAASAIGDLVSQSSSVSSSDITDIFQIASTIMKPYSTTTLKMRVSSLTGDSGGTPKVDWSSGSGLTALTTGSTVTGVPTGVIAAGQSVVMSEVTYSYDSPVDLMMPNAVTFTRKFYLRPRKSDKVVKTN